MQKAAIGPVNYAELRDLAEAMRKYVNMNPESSEGLTNLIPHFISQASSDIRHKPWRLGRRQQIPFPTLLDMAFKIVNTRTVKSFPSHLLALRDY
ncbi:hypothetical protein AAY473_024101 [Plecturocebus cupreus]